MQRFAVCGNNNDVLNTFPVWEAFKVSHPVVFHGCLNSKVRKSGAKRDLKRLVKPVNVKQKNKVSNYVGYYKYSPVREEDQIPTEKAGKNFQQSVKKMLVLDYELSNNCHMRGKRGSPLFILALLNWSWIFLAVAGKKGDK